MMAHWNGGAIPLLWMQVNTPAPDYELSCPDAECLPAEGRHGDSSALRLTFVQAAILVFAIVPPFFCLFFGRFLHFCFTFSSLSWTNHPPTLPHILRQRVEIFAKLLIAVRWNMVVVGPPGSLHHVKCPSVIATLWPVTEECQLSPASVDTRTENVSSLSTPSSHIHTRTYAAPPPFFVPMSHTCSLSQQPLFHGGALESFMWC